jgi:hypothetical protein
MTFERLRLNCSFSKETYFKTCLTNTAVVHSQYVLEKAHVFYT